MDTMTFREFQESGPTGCPPNKTDRFFQNAFTFEALSPQSAFMTELRRYVRMVPAGRDFVHEGDEGGSVIWVMSGWVGTSKLLSDGRRQLTDLVAPVDVIDNAGADDAVATNTVTALTKAVVANYPRSHLSQRYLEFPELCLIVDKLKAARQVRRSQRILLLGRGSALERVAGALVDLYVQAQAIDMEDAHAIRLPLRQKEIGDLVGLTAVHVCRTLRQLSCQGMVETGDLGIVVRDVRRLADICEIDLEQYRTSVLLTGSSSKSPVRL